LASSVISSMFAPIFRLDDPDPPDPHADSGTTARPAATIAPRSRLRREMSEVILPMVCALLEVRFSERSETDRRACHDRQLDVTIA
jgi:hypothetical protein